MSKQSGKEKAQRCHLCAKKMSSSTAKLKKIVNTTTNKSNRRCFFANSILMSMILEMRLSSDF